MNFAELSGQRVGTADVGCGGTLGLDGNLLAGEILEQMLHARRVQRRLNEIGCICNKFSVKSLEWVVDRIGCCSRSSAGGLSRARRDLGVRLFQILKRTDFRMIWEKFGELSLSLSECS